MNGRYNLITLVFQSLQPTELHHLLNLMKEDRFGNTEDGITDALVDRRRSVCQFRQVPRRTPIHQILIMCVRVRVFVGSRVPVGIAW